MKPMTINYICFAILLGLLTAVVSTIPAAIKAKQTISKGVQQDLDKTIAKHNQ